MPMYTFACPCCSHYDDQFHRMASVPKHPKCPKCGQKMGRIYRPPQISVFSEYVTSDITGSPVAVTSRRAENDLCKAHGVRRGEQGEKPKKRTAPTLPPFREDYERTRQEMGVV